MNAPTCTDLFCGAGGSSLGAEAAGMQLVMAANHWETAIEVHQHHFPDAGHDCADISQVDPRRYPKTDVLLASPECFPAGTLVATARGQVPIEQVRVGDLALTHRGRWRRVVRTQQGEAATVVVKGQGHWGLEVTPNHGFPLREQLRKWDNDRRRYDRVLGDVEKVKIGDAVTEGLGRHRWAALTDIEPLDVMIESVDDELLWLCGRYVADGSVDLRPGRGGVVTISVGEGKVDRDRPRLEAFGFVGRRVRTAWNFDLRNRHLAGWLADRFGSGAVAKKLPSWLYGQPDLARHFLDGYVSGDGHVGRRASAASTVSRALAVSLRMLLVEQGFHPVVNRSKQHNVTIEGRNVNVQPWVYQVRWENNASQRTGIVDDGTAWTLVKSIEPGSTTPVPVFNIEVEEDHTYMADGVVVFNCTNHSAARGVSRARQQPSLWDAPDPSAERSRATMWDVPRFAEQLQYDAIVVENVVEATKWVGWRGWCVAMDDLGYQRHVLSHNSMHHGVAQSRDRIYVVLTKAGLNIDLEMELTAWCDRCAAVTACRQAWKNDRTVGRYRQQWHWTCTTCGSVVEPGWVPASSIIDWTLDCPPIGERDRPLSAKTRARIAAGLARYGWLEPIITAGAGNTHERTPGNRARSLHDPLPAQQTTQTSALAAPFLVQTAHGGERRPIGVDEAHPTVTASDDRHSLVVPIRNNGVAYPTSDVEAAVDECGFRMLQPHEVAAAMAFPEGYIPGTYTKRDQVKLAGNAVTPPVMQWITGRVLQALEAA